MNISDTQSVEAIIAPTLFFQMECNSFNGNGLHFCKANHYRNNDHAKIMFHKGNGRRAANRTNNGAAARVFDIQPRKMQYDGMTKNVAKIGNSNGVIFDAALMEFRKNAEPFRRLA
jgi:hypothetical protein